MKTRILKLSFVTFVVAFITVSCNSFTEKENVNEAKAEVVVATQELEQARLDVANEYDTYKADIEAKLIENDREIANLKSELKNEKKEVRETYDKELDALYQKNEKLKLDIKDYKGSVSDKWDTFKNSFKHDMDDLGKSISEYTKNSINKK